MRLLLVTPPMTQLNTPYPATAYLTGFLRLHEARLGLEVTQADAALELFLRVFSRAGIQRVLDEQMAVGTLKRSKGVVRGPSRPDRAFFEVLEADLIQAATLLSGAAPAVSEPPRRRLRWRP